MQTIALGNGDPDAKPHRTDDEKILEKMRFGNGA